jgi:dihydroflavonol-4-reductase
VPAVALRSRRANRRRAQIHSRPVGKTLVTGGNGFIGSAVVRLLAKRGDDLRLTRRRRSRWENVDDLDVETVDCDVLDRTAVRKAMKGVDRVFHVAGLVSTRAADADRLYEVNVKGTRTVLEEALRANVERVVYTSSCAAIGPAELGKTTDERQLFTAGHLGIPYVNSKHEAEVEAFRLAARGLPVVAVNPSYAFGRGDVYVHATALVRRFILRQIPVYVPGALNIVDVRDVARGHLLADERGHTGERYILGNRNFTLDRLFADLARYSGVEPPALRLAAGPALRLAQASAAASLGRAPITVQEVRLASQWWTYRSTKAKRELGWHPSPHEDTLEETVGWYVEREGGRIQRARRSQPLQFKAAAAALNAFGGAASATRRLFPLVAA